jgi:hypothetical protein
MEDGEFHEGASGAVRRGMRGGRSGEQRKEGEIKERAEAAVERREKEEG